MTQQFSFVRAELALTRAASFGVRDAADVLAQSLRDAGIPALSRAAATGAAVAIGSAVAPGTIDALRPQAVTAMAQSLSQALGGRS